MDRQVELGADAGDESPALAHNATVEEFQRNANEANILVLLPVVEGSVEVVGHIGVSGGGETIGHLGVVVQGMTVGLGVADTKAETDVFIEEVGIMQTSVEADCQIIFAIGGTVGQGVQAAAQSETKVIVVPALLSLCSESQTRNSKHCNYLFHLLKS